MLFDQNNNNFDYNDDYDESLNEFHYGTQHDLFNVLFANSSQKTMPSSSSLVDDPNSIPVSSSPVEPLEKSTTVIDAETEPAPTLPTINPIERFRLNGENVPSMLPSFEIIYNALHQTEKMPYVSNYQAICIRKNSNDKIGIPMLMTCFYMALLQGKPCEGVLLQFATTSKVYTFLKMTDKMLVPADRPDVTTFFGFVPIKLIPRRERIVFDTDIANNELTLYHILANSVSMYNTLVYIKFAIIDLRQITNSGIPMILPNHNIEIVTRRFNYILSDCKINLAGFANKKMFDEPTVPAEAFMSFDVNGEGLMMTAYKGNRVCQHTFKRDHTSLIPNNCKFDSLKKTSQLDINVLNQTHSTSFSSSEYLKNVITELFRLARRLDIHLSYIEADARGYLMSACIEASLYSTAIYNSTAIDPQLKMVVYGHMVRIAAVIALIYSLQHIVVAHCHTKAAQYISSVISATLLLCSNAPSKTEFCRVLFNVLFLNTTRFIAAPSIITCDMPVLHLVYELYYLQMYDLHLRNIQPLNIVSAMNRAGLYIPFRRISENPEIVSETQAQDFDSTELSSIITFGTHQFDVTTLGGIVYNLYFNYVNGTGDFNDILDKAGEIIINLVQEMDDILAVRYRKGEKRSPFIALNPHSPTGNRLQRESDVLASMTSVQYQTLDSTFTGSNYEKLSNKKRPAPERLSREGRPLGRPRYLISAKYMNRYARPIKTPDEYKKHTNVGIDLKRFYALLDHIKKSNSFDVTREVKMDLIVVLWYLCSQQMQTPDISESSTKRNDQVPALFERDKVLFADESTPALYQYELTVFDDVRPKDHEGRTIIDTRWMAHRAFSINMQTNGLLTTLTSIGFRQDISSAAKFFGDKIPSAYLVPISKYGLPVRFSNLAPMRIMMNSVVVPSYPITQSRYYIAWMIHQSINDGDFRALFALARESEILYFWLEEKLATKLLKFVRSMDQESKQAFKQLVMSFFNSHPNPIGAFDDDGDLFSPSYNSKFFLSDDEEDEDGDNLFLVNQSQLEVTESSESSSSPSLRSPQLNYDGDLFFNSPKSGPVDLSEFLLFENLASSDSYSSPHSSEDESTSPPEEFIFEIPTNAQVTTRRGIKDSMTIATPEDKLPLHSFLRLVVCFGLAAPLIDDTKDIKQYIGTNAIFNNVIVRLTSLGVPPGIAHNMYHHMGRAGRLLLTNKYSYNVDEDDARGWNSVLSDSNYEAETKTEIKQYKFMHYLNHHALLQEQYLPSKYEMYARINSYITRAHEGESALSTLHLRPVSGMNTSRRIHAPSAITAVDGATQRLITGNSIIYDETYVDSGQNKLVTAVILGKPDVVPESSNNKIGFDSIRQQHNVLAATQIEAEVDIDNSVLLGEVSPIDIKCRSSVIYSVPNILLKSVGAGSLIQKVRDHYQTNIEENLSNIFSMDTLYPVDQFAWFQYNGVKITGVTLFKNLHRNSNYLAFVTPAKNRDLVILEYLERKGRFKPTKFERLTPFYFESHTLIQVNVSLNGYEISAQRFGSQIRYVRYSDISTNTNAEFVPSLRMSTTGTTMLPDLRYWSLRSTKPILEGKEIVVAMPPSIPWQQFLINAHNNFFDTVNSSRSLLADDSTKTYTGKVADIFYTTGPNGDLPIKAVPCFSYISKGDKDRWFKTSPLPFFLPRISFNERHAWRFVSITKK